MSDIFTERRRYPRIEKELPLKIKTEDYDIVTQTKNISCIGAYCSVNRYIPPLTKLSIMLLLPLKSKNRNTTARIKFIGTVVRTEQNSHNAFEIAIFFNEISQRDKEKISKYVNGHIP